MSQAVRAARGFHSLWGERGARGLAMAGGNEQKFHPLPPFSHETAVQKVRKAEDAWNSKDPERVALAYTPETKWRNRSEFPKGREGVKDFLKRKWSKEHEYRLIKEMWAFTENRIAARCCPLFVQFFFLFGLIFVGVFLIAGSATSSVMTATIGSGLTVTRCGSSTRKRAKCALATPASTTSPSKRATVCSTGQPAPLGLLTTLASRSWASEVGCSGSLRWL